MRKKEQRALFLNRTCLRGMLSNRRANISCCLWRGQALRSLARPIKRFFHSLELYKKRQYQQRQLPHWLAFLKRRQKSARISSGPRFKTRRQKTFRSAFSYSQAFKFIFQSLPASSQLRICSLSRIPPALPV